MRKGVVNFDVKQIYGIIPSASFVGLTISNFVLAFLAIQWVFGIILFPLFWPLFWSLIKQYILVILLAILTAVSKTILKLIASKYLVDPSAVKHRRLLGVFEFVMLYISMLGGIITGIVRFIISLIITLFTVNMIHEPLMPYWIERIRFILLDKVYKAYLSLVYMHHLHNHPVLLTFVSFIKPNHKKKEDEKKSSKKLLVVRNKFYLAYFLTTNKRFDFNKLRKKKEEQEKKVEEEEKQDNNKDSKDLIEEEEKIGDLTDIKYIDNSRDLLRGTKDPSLYLGEIDSASVKPNK